MNAQRSPFLSLRAAVLCAAWLFLWAQALAQSAETPAQRVPETALGPRASLASPAGEDQRPEIKAWLPQYRLLGKGRLTFFGIPVYDAQLWAAPGFRAGQLADQLFALELAYLRDFSSQAVAERSIAEMRRSAPLSDAQASAWTREMRRVLPDIKKGDRLMGINRPGVGAVFLVNGKPNGEIQDPEFARLFFGIWLSPHTSEPQLRGALLAGAP